jgi:tetratricopeptide (TPR) repeat protein
MPGKRQSGRGGATAKRWQKVEVAYLEKHAADKTVEQLAERFHTDVAAVRAKLTDLRVVAAASQVADEGLESYRRGMEALYASKWKEAEELLTAAAGKADSTDLAARARQFATTARSRREKVEDADPYLEAVVAKNRGELARALELCQEGGRWENEARFAYLAAAVCSLQGQNDAAFPHLRRAIELEPRNRIHAVHDPDLSALRTDPRHSSVFG